MGRHLRISTQTVYEVVDNETGVVVHTSTDEIMAERMAFPSSTHHEGAGEGHMVRIQHCEYPQCDLYLGVNYPDEYCPEHKAQRSA